MQWRVSNFSSEISKCLFIHPVAYNVWYIITTAQCNAASIFIIFVVSIYGYFVSFTILHSMTNVVKAPTTITIKRISICISTKICYSTNLSSRKNDAKSQKIQTNSDVVRVAHFKSIVSLHSTDHSRSRSKSQGKGWFQNELKFWWSFFKKKFAASLDTPCERIHYRIIICCRLGQMFLTHGNAALLPYLLFLCHFFRVCSLERVLQLEKLNAWQYMQYGERSTYLYIHPLQYSMIGMQIVCAWMRAA